MSLPFSRLEFASVVTLPLVSVLLLWTCYVFQRNRKRWRAYDPLVVTLLSLSLVRNLAILLYIVYAKYAAMILHVMANHVAPLLVAQAISATLIWLLHTVHAFQAACLASLALVASAASQYRTTTTTAQLAPAHVTWHIVCLAAFSGCVGVAAMLATPTSQTTPNVTNPSNELNFSIVLGADVLDVRFRIFVVLLHAFLALISLGAMLAACVAYCTRTNRIRHTGSSSLGTGSLDSMVCKQAYCSCADEPVAADYSAATTTTVSSTNSRRPCLSALESQINHEQSSTAYRQSRQRQHTGMETVQPVLTVCYLFYHLPVAIFTLYPELIRPWSVPGVALWLGLIQDILLPVGLSLVDTRFCRWVSNMYQCPDGTVAAVRASSRHLADKLPHQGVVGKFRTFPSLHSPATSSPTKNNVEPRFPITNGSLYTSVDGRLPIVHNYRRPAPAHHAMPPPQQHPIRVQQPYRRQTAGLPPPNAGTTATCCDSCEIDLAPSQSNLHHLAPHPHATTLYKFTASVLGLRNQNMGASNIYNSRSDIEGGSETELNTLEGHHNNSSSNSSDAGSRCSITTQANGDFEFFGHRGTPAPPALLGGHRYHYHHRSAEALLGPTPPRLTLPLVDGHVSTRGSAHHLNRSEPDFKKVFISGYL